MSNLMKDAFAQLEVSDEQLALSQQAAQFCAEKSPPEKVRKLLDSETGFDEEHWQEMVELGWLGIAIPENYGGIGLSLAEVVSIAEQMGRRNFSTPFIPSTLAAQLILKTGSESQKQTLLAEIIEGKIATTALIEPDQSWDLARIEAKAKKTSNGWQLTGKKTLIFDAAAADYILVSVMVDSSAAIAVLPKQQLQTRLQLRREKIIDDTKRSYALNLEGYEIRNDQLLQEGEVKAALAHFHLCANLLHSAEMVGGTQGCLDFTREYLQTRKQFGRIIGSYQALKHPMVDIYLDYECARSHLYAAASSFNEQGKGEIATYMARICAEKTFSFAGDRSIQFHGGFGFTYECDSQLYRRRAMLHAALYGNANWHKKKLADLLF